MARFQNRQKNEMNLKQNPLFSRSNVNLRTNTNLRANNSELRTRIETEKKSRSQIQIASSLKRKLLVYRKDGKFYIDHSAAYALKLTDVRAIMMDKAKLFEVGLEFLHKMQNDKDIEIEYQEYDKENKVSSREEDLTDTLKSLEAGEYGIGVHGIANGSNEEKQSKALNISNEGLNITNNSKTILSTSISLGTNKEPEALNQDITEYKFGNGPKTTVVIAVPLCVQNENGEKIFLGFPEENKQISGQQYEEHCILDRICARLKKIPPEFILGHVCENENGTKSFMKNSMHYSNLPRESKENLFKELSEHMDDISKNINDYISDGNIQQLNQMKQRMQESSLNTYMIDNAIELAQRYEKEGKEQLPNRDGKRKILLDAYRGVKWSDLLSAKGDLSRGIEVDKKERNEDGGIREDD